MRIRNLLHERGEDEHEMRREDVSVWRRNPRKKRWRRSAERTDWSLILILQSEVMQAQLDGEEYSGGNRFQRLPSSKTSSSECQERYTPITQPHCHHQQPTLACSTSSKAAWIEYPKPSKYTSTGLVLLCGAKKHGSNAAIGRMQNLLPTVLPKNGLGIRIDIVRIVFDSWLLVPTAPNAFSAVDSLIFLILSWIIYCW
jgi:hypothetical protein